MFGFGKKVIVEEVVVPPTRASAAIELIKELAAPIKDYIPLIVVENIILISVLAIMFAVYVLLGEYPSWDRTVVVEKEEVAVSEEVVVPKEIGEEVTHVEYVEMVATSSSSSSGLDDDDDDDDSSVSDVVQEDIIQDEIIEDDQSVEESYNDFLIKAATSEDSDFQKFEAEVFGAEVKDSDVLKSPTASVDKVLDAPIQETAEDDELVIEEPSPSVLDTLSKEMVAEGVVAIEEPTSSQGNAPEDYAPSPEVVKQDVVAAIIEIPSPTPDNNATSEVVSPPSQDEVSALGNLSEDVLDSSTSSSQPSRATKSERATFNVSRTSPKGAKNLTRGRSMKIRKSTSNNSLGNLKRNLSFNKLSSVKKIFK